VSPCDRVPAAALLSLVSQSAVRRILFFDVRGRRDWPVVDGAIADDLLRILLALCHGNVTVHQDLHGPCDRPCRSFCGWGHFVPSSGPAAATARGDASGRLALPSPESGEGHPGREEELPFFV
jgi:hypothetical protein